MDAAAMIKGWALEEGFDVAGIAGLAPSDHGDAFRLWLERGDHAGMRWIERRPETRLRPGSMLEGALSALCVAWRYSPLDGEEVAGDLWPRVARYARGDDYHDLMLERLARLEERIREQFPGTRTRRYVDTGPVLERELAARAGLGAIGKNTMLLHPEIGSYFLLGEIFLTLELPPDEPMADLCGSCSLCLQACPTGALPEPYRLDGRRCLSYWTIEHRGTFPEVISERFEEWVFGCDACQEACPWNRVDASVERPELAVPAHRKELRLADLMGLSRERWVELFRKSPIKRAKLEGLRRNAAAVLGHRGLRGDDETLAAGLESEVPAVRSESARGLVRLAGEGREEVLRRALDGETDETVRMDLEKALGLC